MHDETIYLNGTALHRCLTRFPDAWEAKEKTPLVIGLHGGGGNPEQFMNLWDEVKERNFIFGALEAPYAIHNEQGLSYEWAMWPSGDRDIIARATKQTQKYIINAVNEISTALETDEIYLLGFSQGTIFSYTVGITHYPLFSGMICFSGVGLLTPLVNPFGGEMDKEWLDRSLIEKAKDLPVFITHGKKDESVKYELGVQSKNILREYGYDVSFRSFDGVHSKPPLKIMKEVANWIKTQRK
jgi:phospholipase/carboxylesterase